MSVGLCWENSAVRTCSFHRLTDSGYALPYTYAFCVSAPLPPGTHWARCTPQHCGIKWLHLLDPKEHASQSLLSEEPGSRGRP